MRRVFPAALLAIALAPLATHAGSDDEEWSFVSFPDFFNFDVAYPQPKWESAIDFFLHNVKREDPAFVLVAGDMVDGRWHASKYQVRSLAAVYYSGWIRRMRDHGLRFYTCLGDHEVGDNPWPQKKAKLVPEFKRAYAKWFDMPRNGPEGHKGMTYKVVHNNLLLIAVDTFEMRNGKVHTTVTGKQLAWVDRTLAAHEDVDHKIVMGHVPILRGVRSRSSSGLMLEEGKSSGLWKTMRKHGVDMYFAGEHHAITAKESGGVWQVVHGASWGRVPTVNYLVGTVRGEKLDVTLKRIPLELGGGEVWNANKGTGPAEVVRISEEARRRGFKTVGTLTIDKSGEKKRFKSPTGAFSE